MAKKKKFVIRFHWRAWADIEVKAENLEEAYELAGRKYDNGEYEELPCNYENTDVECITDIYNEINQDDSSKVELPWSYSKHFE